MQILYISLGIILLLILSILFVLGEDLKLIFWYLFSRNNIKYKMIRKYVKGDKALFLLGTVHGLHYKLKHFSHLHLQATLNMINPELLLVESRQEEIEKENLADGPLEMLFIHLLAKDKEIPVKGIDWFEIDIGKPVTTTKTRDKVIYNNIMTNINDYKSVLVLFGASHMLITSKKLKRDGYKRVKLTKAEIDNIFLSENEGFSYHPSTAKYLKIRIESLKKLLNNSLINEIWTKRINIVIENLTIFIVKLEG